MNKKHLAIGALVLAVLAVVAAAAVAVFTGSKTTEVADGGYVDPIMKFHVTIPEGFVPASVIDGIYAYTAYFTSTDIQGNYTLLGANDAQLSFQIDRSGEGFGGALSSAREVSRRTFDKDGATAVEVMNDYTDAEGSEGGCELETRFMVDGVAQKIALYTPGPCTTLENYRAGYDTAVATFGY